MDHRDWEKAFKMIELENHLANHRLTGLIALQGFLFTVLILGTNGLALNKYTQNYEIGITLALMVVCLVGGVAPWLVRDGLVAAYRQVLAAEEWAELVRRNPSVLATQPYPPIVGRPKGSEYDHSDPKATAPNAVTRLSVGTLRLPLLLTIAWSIFFFILPGMVFWK